MHPSYWPEATHHLKRRCKVMKRLIQAHPEGMLVSKRDGFYTLFRAIVGQQISVKAADSVWAKCESAIKPLSPEALLKTPPEILRKCGLSLQKVTYAMHVASFFAETPRTPQFWSTLSDAEAISTLTSIKGVGTWTAEMFLMFHLLRPNVLPVKDIGLLKAMHVHFPDEIPELARGKYHKPAMYEAIAERWQPYRSVATWYLWRALDPVDVAY